MATTTKQTMTTIATNLSNKVLAVLPLVPPLLLLGPLLGNPIPIVTGWIQRFIVHDDDDGGQKDSTDDDVDSSLQPPPPPPVSSQLLAYLTMAVLGYIATDKLIPNIKRYTLQKGISGKDIGKRGTSIEDKDIPEALGIVPGAVFLICSIFCLVGYATSHPSKLLDVNSALLSVCFMLFLGFTDDVLDWPWRYKLFLPSIASLPLLCCYSGSTSVVVPIPLRDLIWNNDQATSLGHLLGKFGIVVDSQAGGALLDLKYFYLIYMGMLAVFCTNAINIYAGINGLEAGQAYIIGCAVLVHNLKEVENHSLGTENHLFSIMIMLSFVGVTLALTKHNWFPASVFVGDTYCYFSGMTFAVVGILGHFSKTLLLFFIPQVINFIWSVPQLFKFVPCPRHRLPKFNPTTGLMEPSTFPCKSNQFRLLKRHPDDTECPNMTVINLCLQLLGPMSERDLCVVLLCFQILCCGMGFFVRYFLAQFVFEA